MESVPVKFGDVITLAAVDEGGFLHADSSVGCYVDRQRRADPSSTCHNFHECLFAIHPKFQYSAFKACEKRLRHAGIHDVNITNWRQKLDPQDAGNADIVRYFQTVLDEQASNDLEKDKSRGLSVMVGSVVQLLHIPSGKYLTQLRNRALNDKLAMEIGLDDGRKGSWWVVRSADGLTADGKRLTYRDRIVFESVKFPGASICVEAEDQSEQHWARISSMEMNSVNVSDKALQEQTTVLHQTVSKRKEVTGSSNACTFQINLFRRCDDDTGELENVQKDHNSVALLRGLNIVCLWRRHEEEFLAVSPEQHHRASWLPRASLFASGSTTPHLRAMWRVVPRRAHLAGKALPQPDSEAVLLQNIASGLYLTAARNSMVALTPQRDQEGCQWMLHSIGSGQSGGGKERAMAEGEIVRVSSVKSQGAEFLSRTKLKAGQEGVGGGYTAEKVAVLRESVGQLDAMEIQVLSDEQAKVVQNIQACKTLLEGVKKGLDMAVSAELGAENAKEAISNVAGVAGERARRAMEHLAQACWNSKASGKMAQEVVRELGVMSLVMQVLEAMLAPYLDGIEATDVRRGIPAPVHALCQALYKVIERACLDNSENGRIMLDSAPVMSRHLPAEVGSYSALLQIYSTSQSMLESLSDSFFEELANTLNRRRDASTVNLLIQSCMCNGLPVRHNQDRWLRHILVDCPHLFLRTLIHLDQIQLEMQGDGGFVYLLKNVVRSGQDNLLAQIEGLETSSASADPTGWVLPYHLSMLRLIQAIVAGRNAHARKAIVERAGELGLSFAMLLRMVGMESTPTVLRAECAKVICALYVDVEPHRTVPSITKVRTWSAMMQPKPSHGARPGTPLELSAPALPTLPTLPADILQPLARADANALKEVLAGEVKQLASEKIAQKSATAKSYFREEYFGGVVQVISQLLRFGFYHEDTGHMADDSVEVPYWQAADLKTLEAIATGLFEAMGAGLEALGSTEAQSVIAARRKQLIISNAEAVLTLMTELLQHGVNHQVSRVFEYWESKVIAKQQLPPPSLSPSPNGDPIQTPSMAARYRGLYSGAMQGGQFKGPNSKQPPDTPSSGPSGVATSNTPPLRQAQSMRAPFSSTPIPAENTSRALEANGNGTGNGARPTSPNRASGGTRAANRVERTEAAVEHEEIKALCQGVLKENPLLPLISASDLLSIGGANSRAGGTGSSISDPPKVLRILFSLISRRSRAAKESAFGFLIALFYQRHALCSTLCSVQVVVSPELSGKLATLHRQTLALRRHVREVIATRSEGPGQGNRSSIGVCHRILETWADECGEAQALGSGDEPFEMQALLRNFNVPTILATILAIDVDVQPELVPGSLRVAKSSGLRALMASVYKVLAFLCWRSPHQQRAVITQHEPTLWAHTEIDGVNPECVLLAIAADAPSLLKGWIHRTLGLMDKFRLVRPSWLRLLRLLVVNSDKDRPLMVVTGLQELTLHQPLDVVNSREGWDLRAEMLAEPSREDGWLERHIESVELLAAISASRNPAAQIYASSFVSCRTALDTIVSADVKTTGDKVPALLPQLYRLRAAYVRFLRAVYVKTEVRRLFDDVQSEHAGFWSPARTGPDRQDKSGMTALREELEKCTRMDVMGHEHGESELCELVFDALLPMLYTYFEAPEDLPLSEPGNRNTAVLLLEAAKQLQLREGRGRFLDVKVVNEWENWQRRLVAAISSRLGLQVDQAWLARIEAGKQDSLAAAAALAAGVMSPASVASPRSAAEAGGTLQQLRTLRNSWQSLCNEIRKELIRDTDKCVLPLMLGSEEAMETAENETLSYRQVVQELAVVVQHHNVSEAMLLDLLLTIRLSIYVSEPSAPGPLPQTEVEEAFGRFAQSSPLKKMHGAGSRTVEWLQTKFDSLGCTTMAMRLSCHSNKKVHAEALRLLLALVQGPNTTVQKSALASFSVGVKADLWFGTCSEVLRAAIGKLHKAHKQSKASKSARDRAEDAWQEVGCQVTWQEVGCQSGLDTAESGNEEEETLGARGRVMMTLRLLELLCKKQSVAWQDVMMRQTSSTASYDLLRHCLDLLETLQPMLQSTQWSRNKAMFSLAMQTVNTITAMIEGPHEGNQKALLSTTFLSTVNRLISGVVYVAEQSLVSQNLKHNGGKGAAFEPSDHDMSGHDGPDPTGCKASMNDLRCWFRRAVLRCICSLLEVVKDRQEPMQVVKSLNLTSIVNQIVSAGELLLLTSKSRSEWRQAHRNFAKPHRLLTQQDISHQTWHLNLERGMGFSEGFEEAVEDEMLWNFILLRYLQDFDDGGEVYKVVMSLKQNNPRLHNYLTEHTSFVELSRRINGDVRVDKMYFPVNSSAVLLSKSADFQEEVQILIRGVPRANSIEKYRDLLKMLKEVVSHLKWLQYISRFQIMRWFITYRRQINHAPFRMAALITLLILLFYGVPMDPNTGDLLADGRYFARGAAPAGYVELDYPFANLTSDPWDKGSTYGKVVFNTDYSLKYRISLATRWEHMQEWEAFPETREVIIVLGIMHMCLTIIAGIAHLVLDFPLSWVRSLQEVTDETRKKLSDEKKLALTYGGFDAKSAITLPAGTGGNSDIKPPPVDINVHVSTHVVMWRALKRVPEVVGHSLCLTISVLGVSKSPIFFVFCLADYFRLPGGQMVVGALRTGAPALFRSLLIGIIVITIFGFLTYCFFSQSAIISDDTCHSPFQCISKHILDAFRGDITTVLGNFAAWAFPPMIFWADSWYAVRTLMILCFLLWWAFLLQPVIQGQIIDAFIKLRKARDDANTEMENKCFISGIDRFKFDALQDEWEQRRGGKYTWNYLFFLFWLMVQEPEDLTCIQLQIWEKVSKDKPDFFPAGISAAIQKDDGGDSAQEEIHDWIVNDVNERLERQQQKTDQILALVSALEASIKKMQASKEENGDVGVEAQA